MNEPAPHSSGTPAEVVLHVDAKSVGVYTWPLEMVRLEGEQGVDTYLREAALVDDLYHLQGEPLRVPGDVRLRPQGTGPVLQWMRCSPTTSWIWLMSALPGFWISRHRLSGDLKVLRDASATAVSVDLGRLGSKRIRDRTHLVAHSQSLQQKAWAVRYHRSRFIDLVQKVPDGGDVTANLVMASAEFMAHDAAIYSLLDEIALMLCSMNRIATGLETPTSFSKLTTSAHIGAELGALIAEQKWYATFHERRTGAAHAFAPLVSFSSENDVRLFTHPHPKYSQATPQSVAKDELENDLLSLARELDSFLSQASILLLKMFHSFDTVTMRIAPDENTAPEDVTVWVKGLTFDAAFPPGKEILQDKLTGAIRLTHTSGQMSAIAKEIDQADLQASK